MSNYEVFKQDALIRFLTYDQDFLVRRLELEADEHYIYVDFCKHRFRFDRKNPSLEKLMSPLGEAFSDTWFSENWKPVSSNEALTLCDLLCHSENPIRLSDDYRTLQRLNRVRGGNAEVTLGNGFWKKVIDQFDGREELVSAACEALGGIPAGKGDVAYEIPLFGPIHMRFSFYSSDEEFEPEMTFLFAANICEFLHYETLYYAVNAVIEYLIEYMTLIQQQKSPLWGAIIGDISGSRFEHHNYKKKTDYRLFSVKNCFTDDSAMSIAIANAIMEVDSADRNYDTLSELAVKSMQTIGQKYPDAGYGGNFYDWLFAENPQPYGSYGNGAAMRVSACGAAARSLEDAKIMSKKVTCVSHDHPEALKGAEAVAVAIYLAKNGTSPEQIRDLLEKQYYQLDFTLDEIRKRYRFDVSCQGSVPQSLEAFLESVDFEDAIRNAISIGGDSDTIAAICGSVAAPYYGIPLGILRYARTYLDEYLLDIIDRFHLG